MCVFVHVILTLFWDLLCEYNMREDTTVLIFMCSNTHKWMANEEYQMYKNNYREKSAISLVAYLLREILGNTLCNSMSWWEGAGGV